MISNPERTAQIVDLSQEIFPGMPVFPGLPEVAITMHVSHEEWDGITDSDVVSPAVNRLEMGEHTVTHVCTSSSAGDVFASSACL